MLTVKEAAIQLGVSEATVRRKLKSGELYGEKIIKDWMIPEEIIEEAIKTKDEPIEKKPLSLEQLKMAEGKPVFVKLMGRAKNKHKNSSWIIVNWDVYGKSISPQNVRLNVNAYGLEWIAYAPNRRRASLGINHSAWEPCDLCCPKCETCANYDGWDTYGKPNVCKACGDYSNYVPDDNFCPKCGRPMTESAWNKLEERIGGCLK